MECHGLLQQCTNQASIIHQMALMEQILNMKVILYQLLLLVSVCLFSAALPYCASYSYWLEDGSLVENLEVHIDQGLLHAFFWYPSGWFTLFCLLYKQVWQRNRKIVLHLAWILQGPIKTIKPTAAISETYRQNTSLNLININIY